MEGTFVPNQDIAQEHLLLNGPLGRDDRFSSFARKLGTLHQTALLRGSGCGDNGHQVIWISSMGFEIKRHISDEEAFRALGSLADKVLLTSGAHKRVDKIL